RGRKDGGMWLFMSNNSGIGNTRETIANATSPQDGVNPAIGIRDHSDGMLGTNAVERIPRPRQNLIPVCRVLRVLYQLIPHAFLHAVELLEQMGMESPPEPVIDLAAHQPSVKFLFRATFECL